MPGPIKPQEVQGHRDAALPEEVFEIFNDLIAGAWDGHSAIVLQGAAAAHVAKALNITTGEVFDRNLLDVEESYRRAGWTVEYDKPGYNETYEASFTFSKKRRK